MTVVRLQKAYYPSIHFCPAVVPLAGLTAAERGSFHLLCTKRGLDFFCDGFWWHHYPRTHRSLTIASSRNSGHRNQRFHLQNLKILMSHHSIPDPLEQILMRRVRDERQEKTAKKATKF